MQHCPHDVNLVVTDRSGNLWRMQRLPFGVDCASEILNLIVTEIAHLSLLPRTQYYVHIDNVLFLGSEQDLISVKNRFLQVCAQFNITLNVEECNHPSTLCPFTGMLLDFRQHRVKLLDRFVQSLAPLEDLRTFADLERLNSKLLYGAAVLRLRLHPFHWFVKIFRRRLSALAAGARAWHDPVDLPFRAWADLRSLYASVKTNAWAHVLPPMSPDLSRPDDLPILVSDATLDSYGVVLYERGVIVEAHGEKFSGAPPHITVAESAAALAGLVRFAERLSGRTFVLLLDNTSAEQALRNDRAKDMELDFTADLFNTLARSLKATPLVGRIASKDNVADAPSRAKPISALCSAASLATAHNVIQHVIATSVGVRYQQLTAG